MRKIINGKKYDTETATIVCTTDNGRPRTDFQFCMETLYLKKTGEYFLQGEGGAASKYAELHCGYNTSGERLIPFTLEDAKAFVEEHGSVEDYEMLFGEVEE